MSACWRNTMRFPFPSPTSPLERVLLVLFSNVTSPSKSKKRMYNYVIWPRDHSFSLPLTFLSSLLTFPRARSLSFCNSTTSVIMAAALCSCSSLTLFLSASSMARTKWPESVDPDEDLVGCCFKLVGASRNGVECWFELTGDWVPGKWRQIFYQC